MSSELDEAQTETSIVSFVVRFRQEAGAGGPQAARIGWRGRIRHVQSDAEISFTHFPDAMDFMARYLDGMQNRPAREQPMSTTNPMREGFRLWEQMTQRYVESMVEAMERSADNSAAFRRQVERTVRETLSAWQPGAASHAPDATTQREILTRLATLQAEVATLAAKVDLLLAEQETARDEAD